MQELMQELAEIVVIEAPSKDESVTLSVGIDLHQRLNLNEAFFI